MADENEHERSRDRYRDRVVEDVASHPILKEFREETRGRLKELERAMAEFARSREERDWRIKQQHDDIAKRLDKIDARVEPLVRAQEERDWRSRGHEERIANLEKKPSIATPPLFGDSTFVKAIIALLIAALLTLAGSQVVLG